MRVRNLKNADEILKDCDFLITQPERYRTKFHQLFNNANPIYLEIGMGKGQFLLQNALNNPNINFIGVERSKSIVAKAILKIKPYHLNNLKIIYTDAKDLGNIFCHEISLIYLNFSDPWPKNRHKNRRLTSFEFLNVYDNIFESQKNIIKKTDNEILFESSIISLSNYGYIIDDISLDLLNSGIQNYMSEYEEKFSRQGLKIYYLKVHKK